MQSVFYSQTLAVCVRSALRLCQLLGKRKYRKINCINSICYHPSLYYKTTPILLTESNHPIWNFVLLCHHRPTDNVKQKTMTIQRPNQHYIYTYHPITLKQATAPTITLAYLPPITSGSDYASTVLCKVTIHRNNTKGSRIIQISQKFSFTLFTNRCAVQKRLL